jgi:hypothetical protein
MSPSPGRRREEEGGKEWSSGEESDELPSPRRMLEFLKMRGGKKKGEGRGEKRGGFRESLGGTLYEVDE